jgi:hypothetical protein
VEQSTFSKYEADDAEDYEPAQANVESQKQFVASIGTFQIVVCPVRSRILSSHCVAFVCVGDLNKFKAIVKAAADEYLSSADPIEFEREVKEARMPIYHQELAHIVIKHTLDKKDDERRKITNLLLHCFKTLLITENQFLISFTKV